MHPCERWGSSKCLVKHVFAVCVCLLSVWRLTSTSFKVHAAAGWVKKVWLSCVPVFVHLNMSVKRNPWPCIKITSLHFLIFSYLPCIFLFAFSFVFEGFWNDLWNFTPSFRHCCKRGSAANIHLYVDTRPLRNDLLCTLEAVLPFCYPTSVDLTLSRCPVSKLSFCVFFHCLETIHVLYWVNHAKTRSNGCLSNWGQSACIAGRAVQWCHGDKPLFFYQHTRCSHTLIQAGGHCCNTRPLACPSGSWQRGRGS